MLKVGNLGKRFGSNWLFRGIEFELNKGDRLAVTGANGSGKSTLLRILEGRLEPSAGKVQRADLLRVAGKCPIHKLMTEVEISVDTELAERA